MNVHIDEARNLIAAGCLCLTLLVLLPLSIAAQTTKTPRERLSLNADWRFQKGDPAGTDGQLAYEKIKPWVIASSNDFYMNPNGPRPSRPEGNLGDNVAYAQRDFDDRGWRQLNLPHDWGIEGPFKQALSGRDRQAAVVGRRLVSKTLSRVRRQR